MISKRHAHRVYDRNTPVIRKGDPGWRSDRENYQAPAGTREDNEFRLGSQRHISNPTSVMDGLIRMRAAREVDVSLLPSVSDFAVGDEVGLPMENGRDVMYFRLVEHVTMELTSDGEEFARHRRQWKQIYVTKNGAL